MDNEQNNTFLPLMNGYPYNSSTLKDEHDLIEIENKVAKLKNIGKIIRGETHSNILTFVISRYYDGADLSTKGIQFIIKNSEGIIVEPATNIEYNDNLLKFSWVMSYFATSCKSVTVAIEIYGIIDDDSDYSLKTVPFTLQIEDSLNSADMNVYTASDNLYVNLINRLDKLEDKIFGTSDDSFVTIKDITNAIETIEFETEPIDFTALMEVTINEETN